MELISNMLLKRVISSIVGILIFIGIISWGHFPFFILIALITAVGLREFNTITQHDNYVSLLITSLLFLVVSYLNLIYKIDFPIEYLFILVLMVFFYDSYRQEKLNDIIHTTSFNLLGIIYIVFGLIYFIYLRNLDFKFGLWIALIGTWLTDIGAYFVGKYYGKLKMAPRISPNKTVEGAIGGIVFSFIFVIAVTLYLNVFNGLWLIYAVLLPFVAITGDLFESAIKRAAGVKDSGHIIPGHGGILDRFDSLLFTIPFTYFFLTLFLN